MSKARTLAAAAIAAALALGSPGAARADLEGQLKKMLDVNVQVNSAGVISSSRRGGFYGGSVYVRGKVMNVSILNFTPPSFAAGCGGVDLFGGSFSMINAQQFVQLLRSIAQNAAGYAFHLALKNICEQCSTIISGLQRSIQEMNQFTGNSCQLAKGIVNSGVQALELSDVKGMQGKSLQEGFGDAFESFWGSLQTSIDALDAVGSNGKSPYEEAYELNVVWKAMKDHNMSGWFALGDKQLMEALMTLTGTVILTGPVKDAKGDPSRNIKPIVAGGGLTLRDLLYGNPAAPILRCNDAEKCLNTSMQTVNLKGLQEQLEEAIVGTGPGDTNSVLYKMINGTGGNTEAAVLIGKLGTYGSMLIKVARNAEPGNTAPYTLFDLIKEYLAYELGMLFVQNVVTAVDQGVAASNYETAHAGEWRRQDFARAIDRLNEQLALIAEQVPDPTEYLQTFIAMDNYLVLNHSPFN